MPGRVDATAGVWAAEIADLVRGAGGSGARLAVDVCDPAGLRALQEPRTSSIVEGRS